MSAIMRSLRFAVTVEDYEHWTPGQRADAEKCDCGSYDDHVVHLLVQRMFAAGEDFIRTYPELFRVDLT